MLIDLTDDDEVEQVEPRDGRECPICMYRVPGGVTYDCCAQFCCLGCFRRMHCDRLYECCPFCRVLVSVRMDLLQLRWFRSDGTQGTVCVDPSEPMSQLRRLLPLCPGWNRCPLPVSAVRLFHTRQVLLLGESPLFMSSLSHGSRVNVLFLCGDRLVE